MSEKRDSDERLLPTLIGCTAAGAKGEPLPEKETDWGRMFFLAREQRVLSLIACALLHSKESACPGQIREMLLGMMRNASSANLIRRQRIMRILKEMEESGIHVILLKGYAVADYYAYPESRDSVDCDFLVDRKQEEAALRFFEKKGFIVSRRDRTSHHSVIKNARVGVIELHSSLYAELVGDVWFQGLREKDCIQEATVRINSPDGEYTTLGYTDHLLFLILHMVKHFILSGLTIRMMLDIALFFSENREKIDCERVWGSLKRLHYEELVASILGVMIRDGGFRAEDFPGLPACDTDAMALILRDLAAGGYMGSLETEERYHGGMEYNRQRMLKDKSPAEYRMYMIGWKIRSAAKFMFPTKELLIRLYPFLEHRKWLRPFVRLYQMFAYPARKLFAGVLKDQILSDDSEITEISRERVEMFKKLGMI